MERSFGFRFDFDDDSDGVSKTYSDELGETVGHGCGEETCSTLFGEVVEKTGESWGESEVEETGEERERGRVSARCDATDRPNGFEASKPAMQSGSPGRLSRFTELPAQPTTVLENEQLALHRAAPAPLTRRRTKPKPKR